MTGVPFDDETVALLAEETVTSPPPTLRTATLTRAAAGRPPGRPVNAPRLVEPPIAFDRTVAGMDRLLDSLADDEWEAPAHDDHGRVRDLVAHLTGVERLVLRWLDPDDTVPDLPDHVAATRPVIDELADTDPHDIARQWHEAVRAVADEAAEDRDRMVVFHDLTLTVDQLLLMRTGELWSHSIDICHATGRPLPVLEMESMATLCHALVNAVPLALAYGGASEPGRAARFVLTGQAGGTFTVPLAPEPRTADPEVTIVAEAVDLCRLAVHRLRPDDLDAAIEGDHALATRVLASMDSLARD